MALRGGQKGRISISQSVAMQTPLDLAGQIDQARVAVRAETAQTDLEDLIAAAKEQEATRDKFRITASEQATQRRDALAKTGALNGNKIVGYVAQISAYAAKEQEKRRRKNASQNFNGPTPERARKATNGITTQTVIRGVGGNTEVKNHKIVSLVEKYAAFIPEEFVSAARQLVHDFTVAASGPRITSSFEGSVTSAKGPRHGGVSDYVREAQSTVSLIKAEWHEDSVRDVEWFIVQVIHRADGLPMKLEDSGLRQSPWSANNLEVAKGIGYGGLLRTLALASRFYARQRALGRRLQTDADMLAILRPGPERDEGQVKMLAQSMAAMRALNSQDAARQQWGREFFARKQRESERRDNAVKGGRR